jgi:hypothetical protein
MPPLQEAAFHHVATARRSFCEHDLGSAKPAARIAVAITGPTPKDFMEPPFTLRAGFFISALSEGDTVRQIE